MRFRRRRFSRGRGRGRFRSIRRFSSRRFRRRVRRAFVIGQRF